MRQLLDEPVNRWEAERDRVTSEGWGAQFLARQNTDGSWPKGRWTETVWTLLTLVELGIRPRDAGYTAAFEHVVRRTLPKGSPVSGEVLVKNMDLCHLGFWLRIGSYFVPGDDRLPQLADTVLSLQMPDGGWNCRIRTECNVCHSSFHTTFNVLEGLRGAVAANVISMSAFRDSEARAIEFMLQHKLYRSDKTDKVVNKRFLDLTYPSYWHYTVLRGLDYVRQTPFIKDPRLQHALSFIQSRQKPNGRWPTEKRIPGTTLFDMEKMGQDSRWNTLRALRVLRAARRAPRDAE